MKRIFVAALLAGTAISSAQAADLAARPYTKAPPYVSPIYDWTGFYFGVNAGGGVDRDRTGHGITGLSNNSIYLQPRGIIGGGQVGYNWQTNSSFLGLGPMVFGLEADFQGSDMRDNRTTLFSGVTTNYSQRLDYFGTVRGRVGLATGPVMSYFTGGYAYGNIKTDINQTLVGAGTATTSFDNGRSGYVVGSGVEAALGGNWTGKIEYLYLNLGNRGGTFTTFGIPQAVNTEIRENIFRAGLNYRIGGNSAYAALPAANWTGFYLGGNVGSGLGRNTSSLNVGGIGGVTDTFNLAPDGFVGGGQIGYNWQAGNFVYGLEADYQASSQRDNKTCVLTCSPLLGAAYDARIGSFGTARGRIGYSVGSTLFYATGGYAYGTTRTDVTTNTVGLLATTRVRSNRDGYAVGGGIETPFTFLGLFGPQWTSKTEYLYVNLGRSTDTFLANGVTFTNSTKVNEHVFRTGINYHFNSPIVAKY